MQLVVYPSSYMNEDEARIKLAPFKFSTTDNVKAIVVPDELRNAAISPHYAVGVSSDKKLVFGLLTLCDDQQGCGPVAYGDIIAPRYTSDQTQNPVEITWILAVVEVNVGGDWRREVWELDENGNVTRRYNRPVILKVQDDQGHEFYIPVGNPLAAIGGAAASSWLVFGAITVISAVVYKVVDWLEERDKKEMVEQVIQVAQTHPEVARLVLHPIAGEAVDASNGGLMSQLKNFIVTFGSLVFTIVAMLKLKVFVELLRDLFKR